MAGECEQHGVNGEDQVSADGVFEDVNKAVLNGLVEDAIRVVLGGSVEGVLKGSIEVVVRVALTGVSEHQHQPSSTPVCQARQSACWVPGCPVRWIPDSALQRGAESRIRCLAA